MLLDLSIFCFSVPIKEYLSVYNTGAMPDDYELYYGFTRFAIELNELDNDDKTLPSTDTRFRPDQR